MNRKKSVNKHSLFVQYLLLYFVLAFIPSIIASFSLFFSYQALEEEVICSNEASVKLIQQSLDAKIQDLNDTLLVLEQDAALTRYSLNASPHTAIRSLKNTASLQSILSNIVVHVRDSDCFYSSNGSYQLQDLIYQQFITNLEQNKFSYQEWVDLSNSATRSTFWPVNTVTNTPNYLYLFVPMNLTFENANQYTSRTIVFFIKQDYIQELFHSSQTNMEESILLLNSDLELLSHLTSPSARESVLNICKHLKTNLSSDEPGVYHLEYMDNLIFVSKSAETGLYYVRFLPEQIAFEPIYNIRTYTIAILALVIIISILLITFGMRRSYLPIRTLADYVRNKQPDNTEIGNELSFIRQVFDDAFEKNATLSQTIDKSRNGLTDHLMTALIRGNFSTEESFRNACNNLNIQFNRKYYCVCSLLIEEIVDTQNHPVSIESILETIHSGLPEELLLQTKDLLFAGKLLLFLNSDSDDALFYRNAITAVKNRLLQQNGLLTSIGMGSCYDSYEMVGKSYLESVNALDYRMIYGKDCLITPEMYNNLSEDSYPTADLGLLYSALMAHNAELATVVIDRISDYTKSNNCSLHAAKYICYDIFSVLKKMPNFSNIGYANTLSQTLNITHLTTFDTIDEFFVLLQEIVQNTIGSTNTKNTPSNSDIGQQLTDYINKHCFAYDFQISSMAEHFSISPQYMRKLFKNHTGIGISEYISNIKLEKAMQLLRDTDMNLQDIVIAIGNTDVSGFVRSFKQKTGMTPGQYRKTSL